MAKGKGGFLGQDGLNAPNQATGVSATAGDASATISWTAPSDTGSSAITGYSVQSNNGDGTYLSSYDIANASYSGNSLAVTSSETRPITVAISYDGTKLYVGGQTGDAIDQYTLSTAYDVSSGSYDSVTFPYSGSAGTNVQGMFFKPDGTKFFLTDDQNNRVYAYSMSTAWDLSTASYDSVSFSVSSQSTNTNGLVFNSDGSKFFIVGNVSTTATIYQYDMTTNWDISTASYSSKSLDVSSKTSSGASGLTINSDDTSLFVASWTSDEIYEYQMSTANDLSTASWANTYSTATETTTIFCIYFGDSGTKLYVCSFSDDTIYQYSTGLVDYPTSSPVTITGLTNDTSYTFNVWAINSSGWSAPSDASDAVTPLEPAWVFFSGGTDSNSRVQRVNALSAGNSTDFGDMVHGGKNNACGFGSSTRGFQAQGFLTNVIEFVLFASGGNSTDFGDGQYSSLTYPAGLSNSTRGIIAGGNQTGTQRNRIQYVTMASAGNAATFGSLLASCSQFAECASTTRGVMMGDNSNRSRIQYITIATTGNALSFGSLTTQQDFGCGFSNSTRGVVNCGDGGAGNVMEYITIASTGNSTDFGDLYVKARARPGGMAGGNIGLIAGGYNNDASSQTNVIQSVTIPTTGNSTDFGDLVANSTELAASGNAHGGIS